MRAVVTRVKEARVEIAGKVCGSINQGYLVLLGVAPNDTEEEAKHMAEKIFHLRVFADEAGKMNLNLSQVGGKILAISQFTLYANLKSRRPGFTDAAKPETAKPLYEKFMGFLRDLGAVVEHGEFGADMQVFSINDGPVTLILEIQAPGA